MEQQQYENPKDFKNRAIVGHYHLWYQPMAIKNAMSNMIVLGKGYTLVLWLPWREEA